MQQAYEQQVQEQQQQRQRQGHSETHRCPEQPASAAVVWRAGEGAAACPRPRSAWLP